MDGFLSLLLFGVLFYVMMRFGCGAHMIHGHHGKDREQGIGDNNHVDPVCGRTVDPNEGYGKMHENQLYRFCSRQCLDTFEADPAHYASKRAQAR